MSATVLVSGKLLRDPERKMSKAGKPFVTAVLRDGDGEAVNWWTILTFIFNSKGGEQRISFTLFADRVISAKRQKRERPAQKGMEPQNQSRAGPQSTEPPAGQFDDEIPF